MKYRSKVNKRKDKRIFTKTASKSKGINMAMPMRGGIRL
jgi:hypothetical protein